MHFECEYRYVCISIDKKKNKHCFIKKKEKKKRSMLGTFINVSLYILVIRLIM